MSLRPDRDATILALFVRLGGKRLHPDSSTYVIPVQHLSMNASCFGMTREQVVRGLAPVMRANRTVVTFPEFVSLLSRSGARWDGPYVDAIFPDSKLHNDILARASSAGIGSGTTTSNAASHSRVGSARSSRGGADVPGSGRSGRASTGLRDGGNSGSPNLLMSTTTTADLASTYDQELDRHAERIASSLLYTARIPRSYEMDLPEATNRRPSPEIPRWKSPQRAPPPGGSSTTSTNVYRGLSPQRQMQRQADEASAPLTSIAALLLERMSHPPQHKPRPPSSSHARQAPPPYGTTTAPPQQPRSLVPRCASRCPDRYKFKPLNKDDTGPGHWHSRASQRRPETTSSGRIVDSPRTSPRRFGRGDASGGQQHALASRDDRGFSPAIRQHEDEEGRMQGDDEDMEFPLMQKEDVPRVYDDVAETDEAHGGEEIAPDVAIRLPIWRHHRRHAATLQVQTCLRWKRSTALALARGGALLIQRCARAFVRRRDLGKLFGRENLRPALSELRKALAAMPSSSAAATSAPQHPRQRMTPLPKLKEEQQSSTARTAAEANVQLPPPPPELLRLSTSLSAVPPPRAAQGKPRPRSDVRTGSASSRRGKGADLRAEGSTSMDVNAYSIRPSVMAAKRDKAARVLQHLFLIPIAKKRLRQRRERVVESLEADERVHRIVDVQAFARAVTSTIRLVHSVRVAARRRQLRLMQAVVRGFIARRRFRLRWAAWEHENAHRIEMENKRELLTRCIAKWRGLAPRRRYRVMLKRLELYHVRRIELERRERAAYVLQNLAHMLHAKNIRMGLAKRVKQSVDQRTELEKRISAAFSIQLLVRKFLARCLSRVRSRAVQRAEAERIDQERREYVALLIQHQIAHRAGYIDAAKIVFDRMCRLRLPVTQRAARVFLANRRRAHRSDASRTARLQDALAEDASLVQASARAYHSLNGVVRPLIAKHIVTEVVHGLVGPPATTAAQPPLITAAGVSRHDSVIMNKSQRKASGSATTASAGSSSSTSSTTAPSATTKSHGSSQHNTSIRAPAPRGAAATGTASAGNAGGSRPAGGRPPATPR